VGNDDDAGTEPTDDQRPARPPVPSWADEATIAVPEYELLRDEVDE
jgi:hypothetical protein